MRRGRYMVTFGLFDAVPLSVLRRWSHQLRHLTPNDRAVQWRRRVESYLDRGHGGCWLARSDVASVVQDSLMHFHAERYELHAWVIMPNHIHVLFDLLDSYALRTVIHSWKSFTAKRANRLLGRDGSFWQRDYFDTLIRNERHFATAARYIEGNPVKADLCALAEDWPWSSAYGAGAWRQR